MTNDVTIAGYRGYLGNQSIKRHGVTIEWTPHMVAEWLKCSKDVIYFVETYMKIINPDGVEVNFKLFDYQKELLLSIANNRYTISAMARRAGKSTVTCGFILWYIIFHENHTVGLLANRGETAREIFGKVRMAYEKLPKWLQQGVIEWNKGSVMLENGSRVFATASSDDNIRGWGCQLVFIDEVAHIEGWNEFYTSVMPTISAGKKTKLVMVSTPNGLNHFHDYWMGATTKDPKKKNGYHPVKVTWQDVPFYTSNPNWKQETLASMNFDYEKFAQEYDVEFIGSSGTLIPGWRLKEMVSEIETPLIWHKNGLKLYEQPTTSSKYCLIADVSRGKGLDYSAFSVINVTKMPYVQSAVFRDNLITPIDYAETIYRVAKSFNNADVLVEVNDIGEQVSESIFYDFAYENILFTENAGRAGKRISAGFGAKEKDKGIRTTKTVKAVGCTILRLLIEQRKLIIKDKATVDELMTFSRKNQSWEAEEGKHDDLVAGLFLFSWMTDQGYFKEATDINTLALLREKTEEQLNDEMLSFGFYDAADEDDAQPIVATPKSNWLGFSDDVQRETEWVGFKQG